MVVLEYQPFLIQFLRGLFRRPYYRISEPFNNRSSMLLSNHMVFNSIIFEVILLLSCRMFNIATVYYFDILYLFYFKQYLVD